MVCQIYKLFILVFIDLFILCIELSANPLLAQNFAAMQQMNGGQQQQQPNAQHPQQMGNQGFAHGYPFNDSKNKK